MRKNISNFPSHWTCTTVGEVGKVVTGNTPSTKDKENYGDFLPYVKPPQLTNRPINSSDDFLSEKGAEKARIAPENSVLVSCIGNLGKAAINSVPVAFNQQINAILPSSGIDGKFIFYQTQSREFIRQLEERATATTISIVNKGNFEKVSVVVPPFEEQKDIVAKIETLFSELDKGIESLKTARQQLKAYRQAVLKHAFEGKLTGQWRQQNSEKPKSSMPEPRECQGIVIPESWRVCCVQDVLVLGPSNGRSVKDRDGGFPVLRLTALKNGRIDVSEYKNGNWCREEAEPFIVKKGDFLLSRGNGSKHLVGRGGLVPEHTFEVAFPDTMVRLRVDQDLAHPDYFSLLWESRVTRQQIEASARTTAGIYKINQGHIKAFSIPIPGIDEQKEIANRLQQTLSVVDKQESELIDVLASSEILRQSILKKAFSGQLVRFS